MRKLATQLEDLFITIAFAEEREFNALRESLRKASQKAEDALTAVAFAEAGEFETAASYVTKRVPPPKGRPSRPIARNHGGLCTSRVRFGVGR